MRIRGVKSKKKNPITIRVAIYCRQSLADDLEFSSTDSQSQSNHAYVESQKDKGWTALSQDYVDHGYSGGTLNRPAFQKLVQDVEDGKVDVIVIHKIDRISRSLNDFVKIHDFLSKHDVALVATSQPFDTSTPVGRMTINLLATFADFEREMIRERTREKMGATRKRGQWTGGRPVLGYVLVDKKLLINEAEAVKVLQIFRLYLECGSLLSVATELNHRGWTTKTYTTKTGKRIEGRSFDKASVQRILSNPLYFGVVEYQGQRYEGAHQGIVDQELFDAVQKQLEAHKWDRDGSVRNRWNCLLMGLTRCKCGAAMTHHYCTKGGKRYHYYTCEATLKKGAAACPGSRIAMRKLEAAVIEKIRIIGEDPDLLKETAAALGRERDERLPELQIEVRHLEKERKSLKVERQELLHAMEQEENGAPGTLEQLVAINESLKKTSLRLEEVHFDLDALNNHIDHEDELKAALQAFSPVWQELFPKEKSRILNLIIDTIIFNGQEQTVEIHFRPGGITALASEFKEEAAA